MTPLPITIVHPINFIEFLKEVENGLLGSGRGSGEKRVNYKFDRLAQFNDGCASIGRIFTPPITADNNGQRTAKRADSDFIAELPL